MCSEERFEDKLRRKIEAKRRARLRRRGPYRKAALAFRQKSPP
ncbi:MAG: hypothetical protein N3F08_01680 [Crenarchaeota archaeon]|nr:hypothetical protein [Thermoproteota archaeon]